MSTPDLDLQIAFFDSPTPELGGFVWDTGQWGSAQWGPLLIDPKEEELVWDLTTWDNYRWAPVPSFSPIPPIDITELEISRGNSAYFEIAELEPDEFVVVLNNRDGKYDPMSSKSPWRGRLKPNRRLYLDLVHNSVTYRVFTGWVDDWPVTDGSDEQGLNVGIVELPASGSARWLNMEIPERDFAVQEGAAPWERIDWLLDLARFPNVYRNINQADIGQIMPATQLGDTAIDLINEAVQAEGFVSFIYQSADGLVTWLPQWTVALSPRSRFPQLTVTDRPTPGEPVWYAAGKRHFTYLDLINEQVTERVVNPNEEDDDNAIDPVPQLSHDSASAQEYGLRVGSTRKLELQTDAMAKADADWVVARFANPAPRFTEIVFTPGDDDVLWEALLPREIGDRVRVRRHLQDGTEHTEEAWIQGLGFALVARNEWEVRWQLIPTQDADQVATAEYDVDVWDSATTGYG